MKGQAVRLLIAEDDYLVNEEIKRSLRGLRYEVVGEASDGKQAVAMACNLMPDVVIMDIKMPKMDGIEASRRIQLRNPMPIVFLTAYESDDLLARAADAGGAAYLVKPPKSVEIDRAITIAMARHDDLMQLRRLNDRLRETEVRLTNIFNTSIPICITDASYRIVMSNSAYKALFVGEERKDVAVRCYDSRPGPTCKTDNCPMKRILRGEKEVVCEPTKLHPAGGMQYFIVTARAFINGNGEIEGIVECFQDITDRKQTEMERDRLLEELQTALKKVKLLSGILPICASCKKIRDDKGSWKQMEGYIKEHSEAEFSHSFCPECAARLYPGMTDAEGRG